MKNLNEYVQQIWSSSTLEQKIDLFKQMVEQSHATKKTKVLAVQKVMTLSKEKIDKFAIDYSLSGMGMKVI